jgi:hypothetical protein
MHNFEPPNSMAGERPIGEDELTRTPNRRAYVIAGLLILSFSLYLLVGGGLAISIDERRTHVD